MSYYKFVIFIFIFEKIDDKFIENNICERAKFS